MALKVRLASLMTLCVACYSSQEAGSESEATEMSSCPAHVNASATAVDLTHGCGGKKDSLLHRERKEGVNKKYLIEEESFNSEFKCEFHWNDDKFVKLKNKTLRWMKARQKSFVRFTFPVMGYANAEVPMNVDEGIVTWVWVLDKHDYMFHYPHNFVVISTASMGIITMDWAWDYDERIVPVSLANFSFDVKDDNYEYEYSVGWCDRDCIEEHASCGIGKHELVKLINNITESEEYVWEWVCLQLPYISSDVMNLPLNFIIPDVLYYTLFLKQFIFERPLFELPMQHQCYMGTDLSKNKAKELFESYFVIPLIAAMLWLYIPLFIHYFPSSSVKKSHLLKTPSGMFPSHKSPNYLGRYLKYLFCYYPPWNSKRVWIFLRRSLFLLLIALSCFRVFYLPYYGKIASVIAITLGIIILCPLFISKHVAPSVNLTIMGWEIPSNLVHINRDLKEYQLLAAIMQERIYLLTDCRFWEAVIYGLCFERFINYPWIDLNSLYSVFKFVIAKFLLLLVGVSVLFSSVPIIVIYYANPMLYFVSEMRITAFKVYYDNQQPVLSLQNVLSAVLGLLIFLTFLFILYVIFFWCYAITEYSLFTLMGGAMLPSMASHYIILVGSILGAVYSLVHSLHKDYEEIIKNIISLLNSERRFRVSSRRVRELVKIEEPSMPSNYTISLVVGGGQRKVLMKHSVVATFLSNELYDFVVEVCHPVRRQVLFIVLQVIAILFYALIVMWVKNVFHLEEHMETIFVLVNTVAVAFVPSLFKFMAYKSYFGQTAGIVLHQNVYFVLYDYIMK